MRPGWMRPSWMSLVRARRATSRRTGSKPLMSTDLGRVVDDQVDAGGLLEGADVAALAADDAALHLVATGGGTTRHGHLGGVVGLDALDGGDDDVAGLVVGLLAGRALDRPREPHRVVLGLVADLLEEEPLASSADIWLTCSRATICSWRALASSSRAFELPLALEQLAIALLEHVGALVELLVALEQATLEAELGALGAGLVLGLALEPDLLVLGLEDQVLLLGARLRDDAARLVLGGLDRLGGPARRGRPCRARLHRRRRITAAMMTGVPSSSSSHPAPEFMRPDVCTNARARSRE